MIFSDHNIMKILNSNLKTIDKTNLYSKKFDAKNLSMIKKIEKKKSVIIIKKKFEHYFIVCDHIQLHEIEKIAVKLIKIKKKKRMLNENVKIEDRKILILIQNTFFIQFIQNIFIQNTFFIQITFSISNKFSIQNAIFISNIFFIQNTFIQNIYIQNTFIQNKFFISIH